MKESTGTLPGPTGTNRMRTQTSPLSLSLSILVCLAVATTSMTGCYAGRHNTTTNFAANDISDARLASIRAADSTADWLTITLGEPTEVRSTPGGELWIYTRRSSITYHDENDRQEWKERTASILIDQDGRIVRTESTQSQSEGWGKLGSSR